MKVKETKDHYVARTYLKRFQNDTNKLYVCNKDKEKYSLQRPETICCEGGWDLIKGSSDISWLKTILGEIEPKLNSAMTSLVQNNSTSEDRFVISAYLAILQTLNPENFKETHAGIESLFQRAFRQMNKNDLPPPPEELLASGFTVKDLIVTANPEVTRIFMTTMLKQLTFSIYTSIWAIIKNKTDLDFFTSDNPFYFLALPVAGHGFAKYIALDPKNLLLVFPPDRVDMRQNNEQEIKFTNTNSGGNIYFETKQENEIALFNTYTIGNASRFIIMQRECEKLKKLISDNIKISTKQLTQTLGNDSESLHVVTTHCNRNAEQQQADMKIFTQLFDKSRQINIL